MSLNAVIFDLDGVICSTDRFHFLAWKELAGQLGGGHNSGHCILPAESLGQAGTRRCLSGRKKDEQNTCVFEERHVK